MGLLRTFAGLLDAILLDALARQRENKRRKPAVFLYLPEKVEANPKEVEPKTPKASDARKLERSEAQVLVPDNRYLLVEKKWDSKGNREIRRDQSERTIHALSPEGQDILRALNRLKR